MSEILHIVCATVPQPPFYGGFFDLYHMVRALHQAGANIYLHCIGEQPEGHSKMQNHCEQIFYYKEQKGWRQWISTMPAAILKNNQPTLINVLLKFEGPILLYGIQFTGLLPDLLKRQKNVLVRVNYIASKYYKHLLRAERNWFKKLLVLHEFKSFASFEKWLATQPVAFAAGDFQDADFFRQLGAKRIEVVPPFHPFDKEVTCESGMGTYCFFHGNLSLPENDYMARWLLSDVFHQLEIPFVIAGKDPSPSLDRLAHAKMHTCLVANPQPKELTELVQKAQIHIFPYFSNTGLKVKLINAAFGGRHIVATPQMVKGTGLEVAAHTGNNAAAFQRLIAQLFYLPFTTEEVALRQHLLESKFDTHVFAKRIFHHLNYSPNPVLDPVQ